MYLNIKNKLGTINCLKKNVIRNRYVMTQYYIISSIYNNFMFDHLYYTNNIQ